ncbi:MAG: glycosyltransferase family 4 protein [Muribaculaceae bacterium]|nr:glycosyltransferase family 4 protein [Muribaculaceae bacterium]
MKIGFDGKRAVANMTGLGNYSRLALESLADALRHDKLMVYTPAMRDNPRLERLLHTYNVEFRLPSGKGLLRKGSLWRTWGISRDLKADGIGLFHGLSNELPLSIRHTGIPSVVTIHDVIYRRLPYCYKPVDRLLYDFKYGHSCRNADRIIAISERTKHDIMEFYGIPEDKIDVAYQGCDPQFRIQLPDHAIEAVRKKYLLPDRYLLQVGTIERRKNLELSVRALPGLPEDITLVAVGRDNNYLDHVRGIAEALGVETRLRVLEGVPFKDLPALNQGAEAVLYPSRYEGFGIPVLEGMESMRPVVAATGSCLEEAGGKAAYYVDPDDPGEMTDILRSIISGTDSGLAERILEGKIQASRFSNDNMARDILRTYRRVL